MVNETIINQTVQQTASLFQSAQQYFYTLVIAIAILLVGLALGLLARKFLRKLLQEIGLNRIFARVGFSQDLEKGVSAAVSYVIYLLTIVFFLDYLGIRSIVLYLAAGGILMLLILTTLVGLKDVIPNFIGWLYLQKNQHLKEGRVIEVHEIHGTIERIGWLETEIKTDKGDILYVPNALFLKKKHRVEK